MTEIPINHPKELKKGMVVVCDHAPQVKLLVTGNHRPYYQDNYKGTPISISNHRFNKIMVRDFEKPDQPPWLACFNPLPPFEIKAYAVE